MTLGLSHSEPILKTPSEGSVPPPRTTLGSEQALFSFRGGVYPAEWRGKVLRRDKPRFLFQI